MKQNAQTRAFPKPSFCVLGMLLYDSPFPALFCRRRSFIKASAAESAPSGNDRDPAGRRDMEASPLPDSRSALALADAHSVPTRSAPYYVLFTVHFLLRTTICYLPHTICWLLIALEYFYVLPLLTAGRLLLTANC